jgi:hypothetical protein
MAVGRDGASDICSIVDHLVLPRRLAPGRDCVLVWRGAVNARAAIVKADETRPEWIAGGRPS